MPFSYKKPDKKPGPWGRIFTIAGIAIGGLIGVFLLTILYFAGTTPSLQEISSQQISQSTKIYDRTGQTLLYQISSGGPNRTIVSFDQIPQTLKDATVELEDENFYSEPAFDWRGIVRSVLHDITNPHSGLQGGSTITQQLARTAFLTLDQTLSRKLKEFVLAVKLNNYYSKDQILDLYLNEVPYGPNISGVETASEAYFGVPVTQINLAQAALLASLPQAPSYYSPWGSHTDELIARQHFTLNKMYSAGKITKQQLNDALAYKLTFNPQSESGIGGGIRAPHFVMAVEQYLYQKYGENMVDRGGLKVITTLNWDMQQAAEAAVTAGVARDKQLYDSNNAALVAQDPTTGQILALVGSVDYFDVKNSGNFDVATQGLRQPGSSLKPFVYMTGFEEGYTPDTILYNVPTEFSTDPSCPSIPNFLASSTKGCYHPQNFEGTFTGPMTARDALAQSVNITAVQMLYLVGEQRAIDNIKNFGVTTLADPNQYGLSLVLGGGAVHLVDLTEAYSVLSQEGVKHNQSMILSVQDASGNTLEEYQDSTSTVADAQSVRLINAVLSDPSARAPLFQASQNLTVFPGYDVALKTGTSNDYRDAWAMGYTPSLVVGVWAGNNDNTPMKRQGSSILAAVPMWSDFLNKVLPLVPNSTFIPPDPPSEPKPILAGQYLIDGQIHSTLYYISKDNPAGPVPSNPNIDPQYKDWEAGVQNWVSYNPSILTSQSNVNSGSFPNAPSAPPNNG
ncbi:MAG TPA: transglycosylase domain-containing protein [Candidatus Paceibacterota bacterium]|nr:transglycosylase domain-containing protein [Candidatus Paceibacterota bacterium]